MKFKANFTETLTLLCISLIVVILFLWNLSYKTKNRIKNITQKNHFLSNFQERFYKTVQRWRRWSPSKFVHAIWQCHPRRARRRFSTTDKRLTFRRRRSEKNYSKIRNFRKASNENSSFLPLTFFRTILTKFLAIKIWPLFAPSYFYRKLKFVWRYK